jgi:hypothetical protein
MASFAGIGHVGDELPSVDGEAGAQLGTTVSVPTVQDLEGDQLLCAAVAEREFLAGEPLPEHALEATPFYWDSLVGDWKQWVEANDLIGEMLATEEDLGGAGSQERYLPLKQIDGRTRQLESGVEQIRRIQDTCRRKDPAGRARLDRILARRSEELRDTIVELRDRKDALNKLKQADDAYGLNELQRCVEQYDEVLRRFVGVLSADELKDARKYGKKAAFRRDAKQLFDDVQRTEDPMARRDLLQTFLDTYPPTEVLGTTEKETIEDVRGKLVVARHEIEQMEMNRAAQKPIAGLGRYDRRPFGEGLAEAARIAEMYPTDWVRGQLQERVVAWLAKALPEKRLAEPAGIEEVETASGNILRGFFTPVSDAAGNVIGYKRYATDAERSNPTKTVGRYPAGELRGTPAASVPRRCVDVYAVTRRNVLVDPSNRNNWTALGRACESMDTGLIDYRRKPGSSRESLEFGREGRFAQVMLTPGAWRQIDAIWGK